MNDIEQFIFDRIKKLIPKMTDISFRASISEKTYSMEFFVTIDGIKHQCYDMVDDGLLDSDALKQCQLEIVDYIRKSDSFVKGIINKYNFTMSSQMKTADAKKKPVHECIANLLIEAAELLDM